MIRWVAETVEATAGADEASLNALLQGRVDKLRTKHADADLLITWRVEGRGELVNYLRRGGLSDDLLKRLRKRYGEASPASWSVSIDCDEPLDVPAEWYDQETIMGDLLRQFRELEANPEISLELEEFLSESHREGRFADYAAVRAEERQPLLLAASKLGIELLTTHDAGNDE